MTFCDFNEFFAFCLLRTLRSLSVDIVTACITGIIRRELSLRELSTFVHLERVFPVSYSRHMPGRHLWLLQIAMPTCHTVRGASCSQQAGLTCCNRLILRWRIDLTTVIVLPTTVAKINDLRFFARYERLFSHEEHTALNRCKRNIWGHKKRQKYYVRDII